MNSSSAPGWASPAVGGRDERDSPPECEWRSAAQLVRAPDLHELVVDAEREDRRRQLPDEHRVRLLAGAEEAERKPHDAEGGPQERVRRQLRGLFLDRACDRALAVFLGEAWRQGDWLGTGWSGLALLAIGLGGAALTRELWRLRHLRRHVALREQAARHWHSETIGESRALCERASTLGLAPNWRKALRDGL